MDLCNFLTSLLDIDFGEIRLKHGRHRLFVRTHCHPRQVWVSLVGQGHGHCGHDPKDMVGWTTSCHGVHFLTEVKSNTGRLIWIVLESGDCECVCCAEDSCTCGDCSCQENSCQG